MPTQNAPASMYRDKEGLGVWEHRGKVAAVGIGHSPTARRWDEGVETSFGAWSILALRNAMEDAGVSPDQVDGLVVSPGGLGENWAPRPIPEDFARAYQLTDNPNDGLSQISVDWVLKNMPELKNVKFTMYGPGCMSNAIVVASQAVGDGLTNTCLVLTTRGNLAGRYGHMTGENPLETASGSNQWQNPWGLGAAATNHAFAFDQYCRKYGSNPDRMAPFVLNQRRNGLMFPEGWYYQHPEPPLTLEDYLSSRWIIKPVRIHDCDRPIQVGIAYLFTTAERAKDMKQPPVYILNHCTTRLKTQARGFYDLEEAEASTDSTARKIYEGSGLTPSDIDVENMYDGFTIFHQFYLEALRWHGVKRGEAHDFYAGDITVEGPHPISPSGGNNGNGRTRTWMHTDSIQQLQGRAGERQLRIRNEIAVSGGPTPASGDFTVWGKNPD